ncbi:MAG: arginine--tRNA ligase [Alphaproteobacteria bacterium]|jgi:arginyl-tRNA synthetase|nr:arginine--tRNA ligase [Alphaproteobacteria bacterium]
MNFFNDLQERIKVALEAMIGDGTLPGGLDLGAVAVEPPRDPEHGDVATNCALVLAKAAKMKPRDIAEPLAARLAEADDVVSADVAGPGFLNLRMTDGFWHARLAEVLTGGTEYGRSDLGATSGKVNVEYVSANPTGPIHVGHARGAVYGDALASLLEFSGFDVTREFYINDAGAQAEALARSVHMRYREALGEDIGDIPSGLYPGEYLRRLGEDLAETKGDAWKSAPEGDWLEPIRSQSVDTMMAMVRGDLDALGIVHSVFSSEMELVRAGRVDALIAELLGRDLIYEGTLDPPKGKEPDDWEPREQSLFRATQFGDDVDRPLKKSDGSWTYFATDMAYHEDKIARGFETLIVVLGADHGGYTKRVNAIVEALAGDKVKMDVKLCQMVKLLRGGEPAKMSKRAGQFVTVRDVVDEVGMDVMRFIMLTRRNDAQLDFDFDLVMEQSRENPVFYVQYAHARCYSVLKKTQSAMPDVDLSAAALAKADLSRLTHASELALMKSLAGWPRTVESAALAHEPHRIAFYLRDLASHFHALWTKGKEDGSLRFLIDGDTELTLARMALVRGCMTGLAVGLGIIGVTPVEELR